MTAPSSLVLRSRRVVTPEGLRPARVVVRDGTIRAIEDHGAPREDDTDLGEAVLMPALVDTHVHVNEPGRSDWEGFDSAGRAAVAGGIGLLVDMPLNSEPVTTDPEALEAKVERARLAAVSHVAFWGGVVPATCNRPDLLEGLDRAGVAGFKAFLCDSGLETFPPLDAGELETAMRHLSGLGRRLLVHAERIGPHPPVRDPADWLATRPPDAELAAIELLTALAARTGCPIHIVHLGSAEPIPVLEQARSEGLDITVETCPHYLTFTADDVTARRPEGDPRFKCAPPLREGRHREALWRALDAGTIDFVASDHSPCPPAMKRRPWGEAWGGIASLQLLLPALWTEARRRGHGVQRIADWLCHRPASWLGLADRGRLEPGARADLVAWHPERSFVVDGRRLEHRHAPTAWDDRELHGVVEATWLDGVQVVEHGRVRPNARAERDGGPGRPMRIRGGFTLAERSGFARLSELSEASKLDSAAVRRALAATCAAAHWVDAVVRALPRCREARDLYREAEAAFDALGRQDWLEAFAAHPRIGDRRSASDTERSEQAATAEAASAVLQALEEANRRYQERFGHVYLVCASGRSAESMLAELELRLEHDAETELRVASEEQRKITLLRLRKLLVSSPLQDSRSP